MNKDNAKLNLLSIFISSSFSFFELIISMDMCSLLLQLSILPLLSIFFQCGLKKSTITD